MNLSLIERRATSLKVSWYTRNAENLTSTIFSIARMPVFRKTGFKSTVMSKKAINPVITNFQSCFVMENLFFMRKMIINTNTNRIPFSFVKNAKEDTIKAKTMKICFRDFKYKPHNRMNKA